MRNYEDQNLESPDECPVAKRGVPKWLVVLGICVLAVSVIGVGRHFYLGWKEKRLVRDALFYLQHDRAKELHLALDCVLQLNPNNLEASRISAQALLKGGDATALPYLRHTVELAPNSLEDHIALAEAALRFGSNPEAAKVIRAIETKARGRADFQNLAGRVAQSLDQAAEAQSHYAEAVRLDPKNPSYRLHLAIIQLSSQDAAVQKAARNDAIQTSPGDPLRPMALRALIVDAVRSMQTRRALALAAELNALPARRFSDRLMYLEVLHLVNAPEFQTILAETQEEAARPPCQVLALLYWMNNNNLALLARDWAQRLPQELTAPVNVRLEMARSYYAFGDWKKLRFFLVDEKWGDLDYLKYAYLSRCYRELEQRDTNSKSTWAEAINAAAANGDSLMTLARMAVRWSWSDEASTALWQAVSKSNRSSEALNTLCQFYFEKRDTAGLLRAYSLLIERNPSDSDALNNSAIFSLLLGKDKAHALNIARELHEKDYVNPVYASTYAFALYCTENQTQALKVMGALKPAELRTPSIAAYYSAILTATGRAKEAQEYKELARKATLLPEEEQILNLTPLQLQPAPAVSEPVRPSATP